MAGRMTHPPRRTDEHGPRRRLLEAAGRLFAEKGFDRATAKEICEHAGTNTAAVNYYFGGIEGLYADVVQEARRRFAALHELTMTGKADARSKLEAYMDLIATLTGGASSSWVLGVLSRELLAPVSAPMPEAEELGKLRTMRALVAELMDLPEDHPAVAHACVSVLAPCLMLLVAGRRTIEGAFPEFGLVAEDASPLARHLTEFALAGLTAVAKLVHESGSARKVA